MAKQHKSVWEIRFRALIQHLKYVEDGLVTQVGYNALRGELNNEEIRLVKVRIDEVKKIKRCAQDLADLPARRIYLVTEGS